MNRFAFVLALLVASTIATADIRPFAFTKDAYPEGQGELEYEQFLTYRTHAGEDHSFTSYDFRHEFEIGVTDHFDIGLEVANWSYEETNEHTGTHYDSSAIEGVYYFLNPAVDPIGLALYGEVGVGSDSLAFEYKLLLQKDWHNWTFAYNLILETELEGVFRKDRENEIEGVLGHAIGIDYALTNSVRIGGEALIESVYADWSEYEHTVVYVGPNLSYTSGGQWWITATSLIQASDVKEEPNFQLRLVAGYEF